MKKDQKSHFAATPSSVSPSNRGALLGFFAANPSFVSPSHRGALLGFFTRKPKQSSDPVFPCTVAMRCPVMTERHSPTHLLCNSH